MKKNKKLKIAIVSLTCCEGCEFALLDLGQRFLDLAKKVDITNFRLIKEEPKRLGPYDVTFLEGSVVTSKNLEELRKLRKVSKKLIVLGNCAHTGGIHRMKNWFGRIRALGMVYRQPKGIENKVIYPIANIVKVDFSIPTCPVDAGEFLQIVYQLLAGRKLQIKQNPVCYECQINGYECLLQKGEICLGPVTLGGCNAICLKSKQACWGCRGLLEEPDVKKFADFLLSRHPKRDVESVLEIFGVKDDWLQQAGDEAAAERKSKALMVAKDKVVTKTRKH
jgi:coenzyme F420-reducing hydrogenase gamma subunit